ncbi:NAD-dependent epimerase/dehydratase family protein [Winogradskya humida]|uniref:Epimerase n=1 Tax=Winogradskya humida TaxID=113566 RepID=A0ABQ3ZPH9_9ACTN|nr:NAD-dependent epimerase/dehydratase family protein [Actinoplanes humidus]GIE20471.1 epimerase [Actinoplanes humidus]
MKVIVFGASGMVGQGVLRESLLADDVEEVLVIGRRALGVHHPKLTEVTVTDLGDLAPLEDRLDGYDACFYCLGISSSGVSEQQYTRISYDYPVAAARILAKHNPEMAFVYVSGAGTDVDGRASWARIKGRTEVEIIKIFPHGYAFRPGLIQPTYGAQSKTRSYRLLYTLMAPVMPLLVRYVPKYTTTTDRLGRAMLRAARLGFPDHVVENADLR